MQIQCSIIIPVFNEEEVLPEAYKRINDVMLRTGRTYELIFVNDGSNDKTAEIVAGYCRNNPHIRLINFSRNFGHMAAITAGLDYASGDAVVIIDADMQDPPEIIPEMISAWEAGNDVVYGVRRKRDGETLFKKTTAKLYYRLLKSITNIDIPVDAGEFRLIDRKVCDAICKLKEKNRYMRGLVSWVGFKQTAVFYDRHERFAGETKYPLHKMIRFAMDGITSFSYKPLRITTMLGIIISAMGFIYMIIALYERLFTDNVVQGWTSTIISILLTQGIMMMMLGLTGEYIGRIFEEIKNRPNYIIRDIVGETCHDDK